MQFEEVYDELRRRAAARLAAEAPGQTLDATALVHEVFLKLLRPDGLDRSHLLAYAAEVMRHVLIDRARAKGRQKRRGRRIDLAEPVAVESLPPDDLLDLSDALDALAADRPAHAELVKLRFFGGLSAEAAAEVLGISKATADRYWLFARAFLHDRLSAENP